VRQAITRSVRGVWGSLQSLEAVASASPLPGWGRSTNGGFGSMRQGCLLLERVAESNAIQRTPSPLANLDWKQVRENSGPVSLMPGWAEPQAKDAGDVVLALRDPRALSLSARADTTKA
jgi:hypothetical protein